MFCTTFYSYKGGVGRTLALANVAAVLARQGKRVLVVDFDLEAPGLTTLPVFSAAAGRPGVVDLVSDYLKAGEVPALGDYITRCYIDEEMGDFSIDLMPAGTGGREYGLRLAQVDWARLYKEQNGFLLMEELRARWQLAGYDYVLIDSRTGYTDVGGICTRQLPDAVVAIFFPNEQNLVGLRDVVQSIRQQGARPKPIDLVFVASRLPRLDDEFDYLKDLLDRFRYELDYTEDDSVRIEQYDSLMLLNQALFVLERPRSGLAAQYQHLAMRIARLNDEDADGALSFAREMADPRRSTGRNLRGPVAHDRLNRIAAAHPEDSLIQHSVARAFYRLRELSRAAVAADLAIAALPQTRTSESIPNNFAATVHRVRLRILTELGSLDEAHVSARAVLEDEQVPAPMIIDALVSLANGTENDVADPMSYPALKERSGTELMSIAERMSSLPAGANLAAALTSVALTRLKLTDDDKRYAAQLILIAGRHFDEAVRIWDGIPPGGHMLGREFNTAMAAWGRDGAPDLDRFRRIYPLFEALPKPEDLTNWHQCYALTAAVLGAPDIAQEQVALSRQLMHETRGLGFSCWTYQDVPKQEFTEHLDELLRFALTGKPPPPAVSSAVIG